MLSMELRCSHVAAEVSVFGIYPGKGTLSAPCGVLCVSLAAGSVCLCVSARVVVLNCLSVGGVWVGEVGNRRKRGELLHVVHCTSELGTGTMNEI